LHKSRLSVPTLDWASDALAPLQLHIIGGDCKKPLIRCRKGGPTGPWTVQAPVSPNLLPNGTSYKVTLTSTRVKGPQPRTMRFLRRSVYILELPPRSREIDLTFTPVRRRSLFHLRRAAHHRILSISSDPELPRTTTRLPAGCVNNEPAWLTPPQRRPRFTFTTAGRRASN